MNPYFLECFKDYNYFKSIITNIKNIRLSKNHDSYLLYFVLHPHYSAYDIKCNKKEEVKKEMLHLIYHIGKLKYFK